MRRARRKARITEIGELQLQVLDILARLGEANIYQILDEIPEAERPHYSTVAAALRGLEARGLAKHHAVEHQYVFEPTVQPAEVRRGVLRDVVAHVFGGSRRQLVRALLQGEDITPELLEELKAEIVAREAESDVD